MIGIQNKSVLITLFEKHDHSIISCLDTINCEETAIILFRCSRTQQINKTIITATSWFGFKKKYKCIILNTFHDSCIRY